MTDYDALRQRMVDNQIRPSEVTDHDVVRAFLAVPRERFVSSAERAFAYADRDLPLPGSGDRRMMAPVQLARMVQALQLRRRDVALVVGCGTGYSAAILARLAASVVALEEDAGLVAKAEERLAAIGVENVAVVHGQLGEGYPGEGPYDAVLVDGSVEFVPEAITEQLAVGGRLAVIERDERISRAMLYERTPGDVARWPLFEAWAPPLPGFDRVRGFVF